MKTAKDLELSLLLKESMIQQLKLKCEQLEDEYVKDLLNILQGSDKDATSKN